MQVLDQITERLYEQTMDAQDGVIYFLLDQMADQHVKELLLAYFLLLQLGNKYSLVADNHPQKTFFATFDTVFRRPPDLHHEYELYN